MSNEPMGVLTLGVTMNVPKENEDEHCSSYDALQYSFTPRQVAVSSVECTQAEAAKIAVKFRDNNVGTKITALWKGEVEL